MNNFPNCSLIISTYNWPEALELCLYSCFKQSHLPSEIIIADDGSRDDTRDLINKLFLTSPIPIQHVWHEDMGFRLGTIRNKAITKSNYDYIIQIDGDLILHHDFIKEHLQIAREGKFISGSRSLIKPEYTNFLLSLKDKSSIQNILLKNLHRKYYSIKSKFLFQLSGLFKSQSEIYNYVLGANMAFWKKDLIEVNGYNEDIIGWGKEDNEIAVRLINSGRELIIAKNLCIVYHLHHNEASREMLEENEILFKKSIEEKLTYSENGLEK